jgi:hypothetical protein
MVPLADRLTAEVLTLERENHPGTPHEMATMRAGRYASRLVTILREYVSTCEADSSSRGEWAKANALSEVFESMGK